MRGRQCKTERKMPDCTKQNWSGGCKIRTTLTNPKVVDRLNRDLRFASLKPESEKMEAATELFGLLPVRSP